jgi:hypothetical protein
MITPGPRERLTLAMALLVLAHTGPSAQQKPGAPKPVLSVFKTAACGCCTLWVDHMRANGFEVRVQDVEDLTETKNRLGVPRHLASCHTAQAGRYVIEGHIPADTVRRLLKERPQTVIGIAVPGMPAGSPGMEVPTGYRQPYSILTFDRRGETTVYERR